MKTLPFLRKTGCLIALAALPWFAAQAEDRPHPAPPTPAMSARPEQLRYDLEIVDGRLLLENIKDRINHNPAWGSGSSIEAKLKNVVDVLRDLNPGVNITISPEAEGIKIDNLKLRSLSIGGQLDALVVASGKRIRWSSSAPDSYLIAMQPTDIGERRIEVFNLTTYLEQAGERDDEEVLKNVSTVQELIVRALKQLSPDDSAPGPAFQFHSGANLLIVTGDPRAIDVARKVVNALSGVDSASSGNLTLQAGTVVGTPFPMRVSRSLPISKERRAILNKLDTIRIDSFSVDSLPLRDVVHTLSENAKKRDPSKTGINFVIDPNQPSGGGKPMPGQAFDPTTGAPAALDPTTGLPIAVPQEMIDIQSVSIRIDPPLNNVRLVDVLDAIVRVADNPIKYTVTDYAVVFALRRADEPQLALPGMTK